MGICKESAQDLKRTALAVHEAEQHLRVAGEDVVEAAAADFLAKRAAHQEVIATVEAEADAEEITPEEAPHDAEAADVAAGGDGGTPASGPEGDKAQPEDKPEPEPEPKGKGDKKS